MKENKFNNIIKILSQLEKDISFDLPERDLFTKI